MRIAIYARTAAREGNPSPSITRQLERLRAHAAAQGWKVVEENVFVDDGQSGIALDRPGLARLRAKASAGELDVVWLTEPERLSRDYRQLRSLSEELQAAGCQVHFLDTLMHQQPSHQPSSLQ